MEPAHPPCQLASLSKTESKKQRALHLLDQLGLQYLNVNGAFVPCDNWSI